MSSVKFINDPVPRLKLIAFYSAITSVILTSITFGIAVMTPPMSGPWCKNGCFQYPYTGIISRFPRDYYWMYPAILVNINFIILLVCVYQLASRRGKVFGLIALVFGVISSTLLITDYFVQLTVVQQSLLYGETDGLALLTQYNPHGIFIAFEELGYLFMGISMFCTVPLFSKSVRLEKTIRIIYNINIIVIFVSMIIVAVIYGLEREYRFEVLVITTNFLTLIISGMFLCKLFKRKDHFNKVVVP